METLSITSFVLEQYFDKSILNFNFSDDIKIKIWLDIDFSIVKDIFDEYFKEKGWEYREKEKPKFCFTFGEKRLSLKHTISLSNDVSALMCTKLDYVRTNLQSDKKCEGVPLKLALIRENNIHKIAENIVELLEE